MSVSEKRFWIGLVILMMADCGCDEFSLPEENLAEYFYNFNIKGQDSQWISAFINESHDRETMVKRMLNTNLSDADLRDDLISDFSKYISQLTIKTMEIKTKNYLIKEYKVKNVIPGCFKICPISKNFTDHNKNELFFILSVLREFMHNEGCVLNGIYSESDNTIFIPFYIDILNELKIPLEEYQPGISRYLSEFPENFMTVEECNSIFCKMQTYFFLKKEKYERFFC